MGSKQPKSATSYGEDCNWMIDGGVKGSPEEETEMDSVESEESSQDEGAGSETRGSLALSEKTITRLPRDFRPTFRSGLLRWQ